MESRTSFFNKTVFTKTITRFWPLWLAYTAVWAITLPFSMAADFSSSHANTLRITTRSVLNLAGEGGVAFAAVAAVLAAMAVFSFLYNPKSAGAFGSFPVKREGIFLSAYFAGLVCLLAGNAVVFAATLLVEAAFGAVELGCLLSWLGSTCLSTVFFYGFAVLCAMLTGHILVLPAVYAVLNFTVYVVEGIVRSLLSSFVYGLTSESFKLTFLSPIIQMVNGHEIREITEMQLLDGAMTQVTVGYEYASWGMMLAYAAAGVIMTIGALLLFKSRRMESAGDVVAVKPLKPVFKYCMAFGCALVLGVILFSITGEVGTEPIFDFMLVMLYMLIGGFVGYFGSEMLMKKSFAVFRSGWAGYAVFSAAILALGLASELDIYGIETWMPEAAEVECVTVYGGGDFTVSEQENIAGVLQLHDRLISCKALYEKREREYNRGGYDEYEPVSINVQYLMEDGSVQRRRYHMYFTEAELNALNSDYTLFKELCNSREAIENRKALENELTVENVTHAVINWFDGQDYTELVISSQEAYELYWECIVPDMKDCTIGRVWPLADAEYYDTACAASIHIEMRIPAQEQRYQNATATVVSEKAPGVAVEYFYESFNTVPTKDSVRTLRWLEEHNIDVCTEGEAREIESHKKYEK